MSVYLTEGEREREATCEVAIDCAKLSSVLNWEFGQFFEPNKICNLWGYRWKSQIGQLYFASLVNLRLHWFFLLLLFFLKKGLIYEGHIVFRKFECLSLFEFSKSTTMLACEAKRFWATQSGSYSSNPTFHKIIVNKYSIR